jgi:hypothetical protein
LKRGFIVKKINPRYKMKTIKLSNPSECQVCAQKFSDGFRIEECGSLSGDFCKSCFDEWVTESNISHAIAAEKKRNQKRAQ